MTKFVITETLWSSIIFKTFMVSLHRGRFVVIIIIIIKNVKIRVTLSWVTLQGHFTESLKSKTKWSAAGEWGQCHASVSSNSHVFKRLRKKLFKLSYQPPELFQSGKFLPKLPFLAIFWAVSSGAGTMGHGGTCPSTFTNGWARGQRRRTFN